MKTGDKVDFYIDTRFGPRQQEGILISFDDNVCMIVPDGKQKTIPIPRGRVRSRQ